MSVWELPAQDLFIKDTWMAEQLQLFGVIFFAFKNTSSEEKQKLILKLKAEILKLKAEIETFKDNENGDGCEGYYILVFLTKMQRRRL